MHAAPCWLPPSPSEAQLSDTSDWETEAGAATTARPAAGKSGEADSTLTSKGSPLRKAKQQDSVVSHAVGTNQEEGHEDYQRAGALL